MGKTKTDVTAQCAQFVSSESHLPPLDATDYRNKENQRVALYSARQYPRP